MNYFFGLFALAMITLVACAFGFGVGKGKIDYYAAISMWYFSVSIISIVIFLYTKNRPSVRNTLRLLTTEKK
jgi:steroid 5-alpha reductase family enzyme